MNYHNFRFPKNGEHLMRKMTVPRFRGDTIEEEECVVIYTDPKKYLYTVQFVDTGLKETYKVPDIDEIADFKADWKRFFGAEPRGLYVFESGILYNSIADCAKAIGVLQSTIIMHLRGDISNVKGYHIYDFT